jgi:hypothetical protein
VFVVGAISLAVFNALTTPAKPETLGYNLSVYALNHRTHIPKDWSEFANWFDREQPGSAGLFRPERLATAFSLDHGSLEPLENYISAPNSESADVLAAKLPIVTAKRDREKAYAWTVNVTFWQFVVEHARTGR